jgi:hypothetical protein
MEAAEEARKLDEAMTPTPKVPPGQPGQPGGQLGGPVPPGQDPNKPIAPDPNKLNFSEFMDLDEF